MTSFRDLFINRPPAARAAALLFIPALAALACHPSSAAPALPELRTLTQADGTSFAARQWGDEWSHGWETVAGQTILFDGTKRSWVFAAPSGSGELQASDRLAGRDQPPVGAKRHLRGRSAITQSRSPAVLAAGSAASRARDSGTNNILTLLIGFSDRTPAYGPADFNALLFSAAPGSMASYYNEVSYNKLSVSPGPAGIRGWYQAPLGHDSYAGLPGNLVYEAAKAADNEGVDFRPYDKDGDCAVDVVNVIHQGTGREVSADSTDIWSESWSLSQARAQNQSQYPAYVTRSPCAKGGYISVDAYMLEPERFGSRMMTVGVFTHEYGHSLGLPDLYDTDGSSKGAGIWSLMAEGTWAGVRVYGDSPSHMDPWSKYKLGWLTPQKIAANTSRTVAIQPANAAPSAFQFGAGGPNSRNGEYFLVENRQKSGFDAGLPGSGMLVWHIAEDAASNDKECFPGGTSCAAQHYRVAPVQADNRWDLEKNLNNGDAGDPFPGSTGNPNFNDSTRPGSKLYAGFGSTLSISVTGAAQPDITATMSYGAPAKVTLSYTSAGAGAGAVSFAPSGSQTSCTSSCANRYATGTVVTLTAKPDAGSRFAGWSGSGGCTGKGACTLTMLTAKTVKATFMPIQQSF